MNFSSSFGYNVQLGVFHDSRSTTKRTIVRVQTTTNKSYALLKTVVLTNFLNKKLGIFPLRSTEVVDRVYTF